MTPDISDKFIHYSTVTEIWSVAKKMYSKKDNISEVHEFEAQLQDIMQGDLL